LASACQGARQAAELWDTRPPLLQLDDFFVGHADRDVNVDQLPGPVLAPQDGG
jgi:hypothetical protein